MGTNEFQGYVNTPLQTLDGIVVNQPKRFLPLAEEAKHLAEEICIEKLNKQLAGIPHEKLLNQSFRDQLSSLQILEQLAPLELAKQHLLADIVDILECLGKADNIPFNQLYYIVENCADRYYTKFSGHQLLLVNTARCLKFFEEYSDQQSQIWKIFHKHHNILDDLQDLHLHFDDFKTSLEKDFKYLKEATSRNIQNIQTSLNLQQMYSSSLCSHVNNIYSNLLELQKQIQHHCMYMNQGDTVQIEAPDFNPDIDGDTSPSTDEKPNKVMIQGTLPPIPEVTKPEDDNSLTPRTTTQQLTSQETDWPDTIPVQIPRVSSSTAQPEEQGSNRSQAQYNIENFEIPELEENSEEEQFADSDSYMAHHNTYQASDHIRQEYRSHLHEWDDDQYYTKIDRVYYSQSTLALQDYWPAIQQPAP